MSSVLLPDSNNKALLNHLPDTALSSLLDKIINRVNDGMIWLWPLLMSIIVFNVLMRYLIGEGRVEFEELQWHLYSAGWLIGLSYCFITDSHVRVDILYDSFSIKTKCWIELVGILTLLAPFVFVVVYYSIPFIAYSWQLSEVSAAPGGLPYRWFIKSILLVGFVFLSFAVVSRLSRIIAALISGKFSRTGGTNGN
ncbi:putative TRAP-type C4-dicarboxylate transport system, small permease component [Vibrio nigripulchritudo SO65]|uniref:TRAP transporter small permease subunit n=1 Tax=Vibrio nigripulchritudo TaxID=28173 RepID=UPI0003B1B6C3|nr:TRAP transporter small permease subunit [Vibrio nigripulchritudo]CCN34392.1 putative TRAP-type C4-dicarboxylate transport system, small permease component [Vibrio nigripulchritudo AM115]CCN39159.1 putative TRAP-type C4-dicarboxylate transport system, small permease component [Vibrio nigripulchritudo FTn2]CCN63184.1 putative TRAP-type C4-dicarboxylate transport system, small permease component [Vibrio nigripulchritudo POn4]CCN78311.1 putative TRAP-type C4-dicarboxylate transport system, small